MGASGTPRQKMIGMMYLVLTALLALNVTKEVLDSFLLINSDLERITSNTTIKSNSLYNQFKEAENNDPLRVKVYRLKADTVRVLSENMLKELENLKKTLTDMIGVDENGVIKNKEEMDKPSELMITRKKGAELKKKIETYKNELKNILASVDKKAIDHINLGLEMKEHKEKDGTLLSWESKNFENVPVVAVQAILSSIETEVKNAEINVLNFLFDHIHANTSVVDAFEARVISPSSYILAGEKYQADIFLAAFNSTLTPQILLNGDTLNSSKISEGTSSLPVEKGIGKYEIQTSREGLVKWGGKIRMKGPDGKIQEYPFRSEFMVARPSVTVSPTKMNVFYTSVDNPVSISAPGIPTENLLPPSINIGTITGTAGNYVVRVNDPGKMAVITVKAKVGGEIKEIGHSEFRVQKLQNPVAKVASSTGGAIDASTLALQWGILIEPGNPQFNVKYSCLSYDIGVYKSNNYIQLSPGNSGQFDTNLRNLFKSLRRGDKIFLDNIKAKQENQTGTLTMNNIYFTIK